MSDEEPADNVLRFAPPQEGEVSDYISPGEQLQFFRERLREVSLALRAANQRAAAAERDLAIALAAIDKVTSFSAASHRELEARLAAAMQQRET